MKKISIGYIYNENKLKKDEKLFLKLAEKNNINLVMINSCREWDEKTLKEKIKDCRLFYNNDSEIFSIELVKTIEEFGKKVIEPSENFYYDEDKWMFFVKCKKHKIPTLNTILLSEDIPVAKKELEEFNCWPVVLKRIEGTMGQYVGKADNLGQAEKIIRKFWKKGSERLPIIAQEFVDSASYRVLVIGKKIAQTALKECDGWKKTGVYTHHIKRFAVDNDLKKIISDLIKVFGVKICGIDLLKKNGKWLVLEINAEPALDFIMKDRTKLFNQILDFLKKEAR